MQFAKVPMFQPDQLYSLRGLTTVHVVACRATQIARNARSRHVGVHGARGDALRARSTPAAPHALQHVEIGEILRPSRCTLRGHQVVQRDEVRSR